MSIPVFNPWIDETDVEAVTACLRNGWISGTSPIIAQFEDEISRISNRRFSVAVANGSVALDLAFQALNLGPGDEVILPNFTIISCLAAVHRTGATAVLVDVDPETWNVSVDTVKSAITANTKAILVVHLYGLPAPILEIEELCESLGIVLVEDAAEAHGQIYQNRPCGNFGKISTFSFYANKHVTTGEGGAVCTNDPVIADRVRTLRNLAFGKVNRFEHEEFAWNYRMSGLAAALGKAQIQKLPFIINEKQNQGKIYSELMEDLKHVFQLPGARFNESENNYWVYGIVGKIPGLASQVVASLADAGIETRPFFWSLSLQPVTATSNVRFLNDYPVSESLSKNGFYIPTGSHINIEVQQKIIEIIRKTSNSYLERLH